jgi:hypothetical protein
MNRPPDMPLSLLLGRAARQLADQPLPPMSPRVVAALARPVSLAPAVQRPPPAAAARPWAWAGMVACLVVLCAAALLMAHEPQPPMSRAAAPASDFLPLSVGQAWLPLSPGAAEGAWLVRTELPKYRLAALGLPYDPGRAGESVRAEVLLHASGEVLAVRLLR